MPLRDGIDQASWDALVAELDWRLTAAIDRSLGPRPDAAALDAVAEGFYELHAGLRSRHAREPDYRRLGVAVAYALAYMPQRVSSVAAALTLLARNGVDLPRRVLDIGSGADATRLALDLSLAEPHRAADGHAGTTLVTVEPSYIMQNFGKAIDAGPGLAPDQIRRYTGSLDYRTCTFDCPPAFSHERDFDCIVLSACLPYDMPASPMYWNGLVREIAERAAEQCVVIVIEPQAKKGLLLRLAEGFAAAGARPVQRYIRIGREPQFDSHGLGPIVRPRQLPFLTNLLMRLDTELRASRRLGTGAALLRSMMTYGIQSWSNSRSECIALAYLENRRPGDQNLDPSWSRFFRDLFRR